MIRMNHYNQELIQCIVILSIVFFSLEELSDKQQDGKEVWSLPSVLLVCSNLLLIQKKSVLFAKGQFFKLRQHNKRRDGKEDNNTSHKQKHSSLLSCIHILLFFNSYEIVSLYAIKRVLNELVCLQFDMKDIMSNVHS